MIKEFMTDPKGWECLGPHFISHQDNKNFKVPLKKAVIDQGALSKFVPREEKVLAKPKRKREKGEKVTEGKAPKQTKVCF